MESGVRERVRALEKGGSDEESRSIDQLIDGMYPPASAWGLRDDSRPPVRRSHSNTVPLSNRPARRCGSARTVRGGVRGDGSGGRVLLWVVVVVVVIGSATFVGGGGSQ